MVIKITPVKALLLSVIGLAVLSIGIGAGTFAFFTSQAVSAANTFAAGTLTLSLSDDDEDVSQSIEASWTTEAGFAPGDSVSGFVLLRNSGTIEADHAQISFSNTVTEATSGPGVMSTVPMDTVLEVAFLCYDSNGDADCTDAGEVDLLPLVEDDNGNTIIDLDDLASASLDDLSLDDLDTDHRLDMEVTFDAGLGVNQHQGDQVDTTVTVVLNQDASQ
jgi:predicted ribosomally synthesized peptide with SipW-like signal peptide